MKILNNKLRWICTLLTGITIAFSSSSCRKELDYGTVELPYRNQVTGQEVVSDAGFKHPGILLSIKDLNNLREQRSASTPEYLTFSASTFAKIDYVPRGPFIKVSRGSGSDDANLNRSAYENDATAILYQAVQWYITGDTTYAGNAMRMLKGWTTTHKQWGHHESYFLACEYGGPYMMAGAEILKYTYPGWTKELNDACVDYCKNMLYPLTNINTGVIRRANQGAIQLMGAMPMAIFCDDRDFYNKVLDIYHNDACAGIIATLPSGQNPDSGRDAGHAYGFFASIAEVAESAWIQGLDLYSELNNRILAMAEYHSRYNLGETVEYQVSHGACYDWYLTINEDGGAADRGKKIWDPNGYALISSAYARLGVPAPNAVKYLNHLNPHPSKFLFNKKASSTASTIPSNLLPAPFVMNPLTGGLSDIDMAGIGTVGIPGSSAYNNGVWTVKGSGNVIPMDGTWNMWYNKWLTSNHATSEPVHFAYKELTGDGAIVAKVTSLDLANGFMTVTNGVNDGIRAGAGAGLMIRTSLTDNASYVLLGMAAGSTSTTSTNGIQIQSRGFTASSNDFVNYFAIDGPMGTRRVPFWLKLERRGNRVMGYCSDTGEFWTPMNVFTLPQSAKMYIGLFANSDDKTKLATATFTDVKMGNQ
ncbi:alginate lyase family protein [Desertivirga xinjiangensis]|uniref:alginate lyase family protein n=1 Tax=Desertivirga xinjiangensis TaxID=539206 RepID=UPI00210E9FFA|nr:alginate lyase family protein [Pedobacter xinjiangensis]